MNHSRKTSPTFFLARVIVLYSAWSVGSGLLLSLFCALSPAAILIAFVPFIGIVIALARISQPWPKPRFRRYRRILPAAFALFLLLSLIGGVLHAPNNYDFLTYRFPRFFYWLSEGGVHWIEHFNRRMNYAGTTSEWCLLPLFLIGGPGDRLFFLLNLGMFACLPMLGFIVSRGLGIRGKASWVLSYLVASLAGAVLQAGSVGNDLPGLFFFMAALAFAIRAVSTKNWIDFCLGIAAAALMTNVKASNIPLLLPVFLLYFRMVPWLWERPRRPIIAVGVSLFAVSLSFVPTGVMNHLHTGSWTGDPNDDGKYQIANPVYGVLGNVLQVAVNSFNPPLFPIAKEWNTRVVDPAYKVPTGFLYPVKQEFPRLDLSAIEIQNEEYAGMGIGIIIGLSGLALAGIFGKKRSPAANIHCPRGYDLIIVLSGLLALGVFLAKFGNESGPRLLLPYYPILLLVFFTVPAFAWAANLRWARGFCGIAVLTILPSLLITPSRPLVPTEFLRQTIRFLGLPENSQNRLNRVFEAYGSRNDMLAAVRNSLPANENRIGWIAGGNDPEVSLWMPFGARKIVPLLTSPEGEILTSPIPRFCVVSQYLLRWFGFTDPNQWASKHGFRIVSQHEVVVTVNRGKEYFYIMEHVAASPPPSEK